MAQTSRISDLEQSTHEGMQAAQQWTTEMVESQPLATVCTVFAAGFVVGVGAVAALSAASPRSQSQKRMAQMEGLSQRIADAVCNAIPHQLSDLWQK